MRSGREVGRCRGRSRVATVHRGRIDDRIEVEVTVVVDGAGSGEVTNHGYLMVAGDVTGRIPHDTGMILVAAGSVVTTPDGCVGYVDAAGRR